MSNGDLMLEMRGVSRRFGSTIANDKVDLAVRKGTIHAVVGENGAGKSTLLKIAYGQIRRDEGQIFVAGKSISLAKHSPQNAIAHSIGMVHQHFMLVAPLTVVENVVLGREPMRHGVVDLKQAATKLNALSKTYGLAVDPHATISELSVGEQQRVELIKVLWQGSDVLILDEPTAVLTPQEVEQLFAVLRDLVAGGKSIVIITHKLDEVVAIADEITVMRRGKVVKHIDASTGEVSVAAIATAMVGRSILLQVDKPPASPGAMVLDVQRLSALSNARTPALKDLDLQVRAGEIVGVAGVEGNGQSELQECIVGLRQPVSGHVYIAGTPIDSDTVANRYFRGMAHIPEDRLARAVIPEFTMQENLVLGRHREFSGRVLMDRQACAQHAAARIADNDIRPTDPQTLVGAMSGGNQQKVVISRELSRPGNRFLVCAQPTRGVDIGAIELIHKQIIAARDAGLAVLLFSAELSELLSLSDRMVVMYGGQVVLELDSDACAQDSARQRIGAAMTGASAGTSSAETEV